MEQEIEETSRADSSHGEPHNLSGDGIAPVKLEENRYESPWFLTPTEVSSLLPDGNTTVPQEYVGENDFTGPVECTEWRGRRRSKVWKDFTVEKKPDGSAGARCKRCNIMLTARSNSGTSHLSRHVKLHCPRNQYGGVRQMPISSSSKENGGDFKGFKFNQDVSRKILAKLVISAQLPFNIVEQPAFVEFVKSVQPLFKHGAQETVRRDCAVLYEEERAKIHGMLKNLNSRVSFTFDMWTSEQNVAYMALHAHFIDDDFVLMKKMLNFKTISHPPTGYLIADEIAKCIVGWELDEKVCALTLGSSTTHDILATRFKENWSEKLLAGGNYFHIRCCADVLTIMIEDGIKALHFAIERIRNIIEYVTATPPHMQAFNESAQQCGLAANTGLILDVSTTWNATYGMLQNALYYKDALIKYAQLHYYGPDSPTHDDWEKVEIIMKFLKSFVDAIDVLSRTKYPTANLYFKELCTIRHLLQDEIADCDETVRNLASEMEKKLRNHWSECNKILAIASVLDPRFKFLLVEYFCANAFGEEEAKRKVAEIRDCLHTLYNDYEKAPNAIKHAISEESSAHGLSGGSSALKPYFNRKDEIGFAAYLAQNGIKRQNLLDYYLDVDVLPYMEDEDFSVLSWWKNNAGLYPVLSRMARDVLAIPVSTVISKPAFGACSRLIERSSISLGSSLIETFICSQDWFNDDNYADANGICNTPVTKFPDVDASNVIDEEIFESSLVE